MNELIRKRAHLRAPLHEGILFECDQYVLSGMCSNISEGGLLIEHLSLVPEKKNFNVIVPLVYFPDFSKIDLMVLAVKHKIYTNMNYLSILKKNNNLVIFDTNGVLTKEKTLVLKDKGFRVLSLGR